MAALEQIATHEGWHRLRLETGTRQPEALALYERTGWTKVPAYGEYKSSPESRCYAKDLRLQVDSGEDQDLLIGEVRHR
jgi:hypothetical protein